MKRHAARSVLCGLLFTMLIGCAQSDRLDLKLSLILGDNSDWYRGAVRWKDLVEARTDSAITVTIYPRAQLASGDQRTELEMVQSGVIDASLESTILLSLVDQRFSVFSLPWLFPNYEVAQQVCDGDAGRHMLDILPENNLVGLAYGVNGFRQLTNSKRPVQRPEDMAGLKIRVPAIRMYIGIFKMLGADPSSMNFGELFLALAQGTMDGQENPLAVIHQTKLYEAQSHVAMWNYSYDPIVLCLSKARWDGLSPDHQKILREAAAEALNHQRRLVQEGEKELIVALEQKGMAFSFPSEETLRLFRDRVGGIYTEYEPVIGAELIQQFRNEVDRATGESL